MAVMVAHHVDTLCTIVEHWLPGAPWRIHLPPPSMHEILLTDIVAADVRPRVQQHILQARMLVQVEYDLVLFLIKPAAYSQLQSGVA